MLLFFLFEHFSGSMTEKKMSDAWASKLRVDDMRGLARAVNISVPTTGNKADTIAAIVADSRAAALISSDSFPTPQNHVIHYQHVVNLIRLLSVVTCLLFHTLR